jgi:3'-5' exoribonuclease
MQQAQVAQLREGAEFEGVLWLVSGQVRQTRTGDPFWEGTFQDATGTIAAKLWDTAGGKRDRVKTMAPLLLAGRPYRLKAKVDAYQSALQLALQSFDRVDPKEVDPSLFSPRSKRSTDEMVHEFDGLIEDMRDPDYKSLLKALREEKDLFRDLCSAPAAKAIHHAWVGGLLEHALSLSRGVLALAPHYPQLNVDLLLCGCFFHDIGKTREISSDPGFDYTTDGKLAGHIYMGAARVEHLCDSLEGFPLEKRRHLVHLVLSHQGDRSEGFGSAADPATPEAIFFHHLDNLDAKLQNCFSAIEEAERKQSDGPFTPPKYGPIRKTYYRVRPDAEWTPSGAAAKVPDDEGSDDGRGINDSDPQPRLW